jgi:hypothetical protein
MSVFGISYALFLGRLDSESKNQNLTYSTAKIGVLTMIWTPRAALAGWNFYDFWPMTPL